MAKGKQLSQPRTTPLGTTTLKKGFVVPGIGRDPGETTTTSISSPTNSASIKGVGTISVFLTSDITNFTISGTPSRDGLPLEFMCVQDGVGGHNITFDPSMFVAGLDIGFPTLDGTANSVDIIGFRWSSHLSKFCLVAYQPRYL